MFMSANQKLLTKRTIIMTQITMSSKQKGNKVQSWNVFQVLYNLANNLTTFHNVKFTNIL